MEDEGSHPGRAGESEWERLDHNMNELLQELRVSQTGVQILFAFLLALPFAQRFTEVTTFQRDVYFASLLLAGAASVFFIAPVSAHRLVFRRREKATLVASANWMAIAGLACLAVAIVCVILLIADFLFSAAVAAVSAGGIALMFAVLWYAVPLSWLLRERQRDSAEAPPGEQ
ncbi:MAG TPA: DUF6328 family protein [Thermoleophilaceae bacterium]|jgi:hypothetical protein